MSAFPEGFCWGVATSAYQIEGSPLADGAGPSIWHRFAHTPGHIADGETGNIACNHYQRYLEDIGLLHELGVNAYRFSIAWGRVLPEGRGAINRKGLGFYQRLVDALLERGISPVITLYHWDLPMALQDRGGWINPDSPQWFADYAEVLFRTFADRVTSWITINEPWVIAVLGHLEGRHAPGWRDPSAAARVGHHLLLAHAAAVASYRTLGHGQIGIALNLEPQHPAYPKAADLLAAQRRDAFVNRWFLDALFLASYPIELAQIFGPAWPKFGAVALDQIHYPGDFIGVNYYTRARVAAAPEAKPLGAICLPPPREKSTAMGWEIYPEGLGEVLGWFKERYGNPRVLITENGAAFADPAPCAGLVLDPQRIVYLRSHLRAAAQALAAGVDLGGYFVWSLMDNFEWAEGYSKRFGLYWVDRQTLQRYPKSSAHFYRSVIATQGAVLAD
ncbi:beta-glucosidase [Caldichromatium japonicum]|uniref:Beta-glucosidase n=1 Tax=Caldichromatium japonicum TaxID=2699430 RepID=A0A6G7VD21_9GAMM|nr:GH1 family beta-glucosidase [Caldichromatium japonicum]QIK37687.1 beta-glucosidase [Caldichromatium japonicum]